MTLQEKMNNFQYDWDRYLIENKNKNFYYDKLLYKLLDKWGITLEEYHKYSK